MAAAPLLLGREAPTKAASGCAAPVSAVEGEGAMYEVGTAMVEKRQELFKGLLGTYSWKTYAIGYVHLALYASCAAFSYVQMVSGGSLLFAVLYGWSMYCVWMIGHECYHWTMAPVRAINEWLGYFCMDCIASSRETWKYAHHHVHHKTPWSTEPLDRQRLFGPNVLTETFGSLYTLILYWAMDFKDFAQRPTVWKLLAMVCKFTMVLHIPLNALAAGLFSLAINANYMALLSHAMPVIGKPTSDGVLRQLRGSIDIFPESSFVIFFSGALNNHAVHHVMPQLPRSLHSEASCKLGRLFPGEHRAVRDLRTLGSLWILRHQIYDEPVLVEDWPRLARGLLSRQLVMDVASLAVLVVIPNFLPAFRLF